MVKVMIKLLQFLLSGCWHKWEVTKYVDVYSDFDSSYPLYGKYYIQCTKCSKMKIFRGE